MTVTTALPTAGITRSNLLDQSTKLAAALKTSVPASVSVENSTPTNAQSTDVNTSALAQSPTVSFRLDALNVAFVGTKVDVIDSGATHVSRLLGQLQSLATRASAGGLSKSALEQLDGQFQALRLAINNVPPGPPNEDIPVSSLVENLPGSTVDNTAFVGGFNDKKLLGNANLLTQEAAQAATPVITAASATIDTQRVVLAAVKNDVDFAAATIDSALQNQNALGSTLTVEEASGNTVPNASLAASLQANPNAAIAAQTNRLPANILQLLSQ